MWRRAFFFIVWAMGTATAQGREKVELERLVDSLLARMSVEEKVGQLQQYSGVEIGEREDAGRSLFVKGGVGSFFDVHGARAVNALQRRAIAGSPNRIPAVFGYDVIHGYRTIFPAPLGLAATWETRAVERVSGLAADEARAAGVAWVFSPVVGIARDPRWGRIVEGAGEDPCLATAMARAQVRGLQGGDSVGPTRVAACAKHWVGYGAAEGGRDYNTTDISERTLRSVYFPPFRAARDAGVGTFMSALNDLDGIPASANPFTLGAVLRGEWGFEGPVVADYKAVGQLIPHGLAADGVEAARLAFSAGVDVEEESHLFGAHLPGLVARGEVPLARLDEATRRVLQLKARLGLFDRPFADEAGEAGAMLRPEARTAAREVAGLSLVLLKNEGDLLPLGPAVRSIAVIGPMADDRMSCLGPWHAAGRADDAVTLLEGVRAEAAAREGPVRVSYAKGCSAEGHDGGGIDEAARLARGADMAIVAVGEPWKMSGEATSRSSLDLPGRQLDLIKAVHATRTPTVVVLMNGRPLTIGWVAENVPSIVEAWYPGVEAGHAIADALFGRINPGGKLPVTFPRVVGQVPIYYDHMATGRPASSTDKYTSKYIDQPIGPLWPFGHGLSYTRFRLSGLTLDTKEIGPDGRLGLRVEIRNVGDRAGDEVVQLYVRDVAASVVRPVRELRAFERVTLGPGEARTLRFSLGPEELGLYDRRMRFVVEPGEFRVFVGTSSVGGHEARFEVVAR